MKFKDFMDLGIKTEEGVLITKYLMDMYIANSDIAKRVKQEFVNHGYSMDVVPGEFLKIFTMNEKEFAELGKVLTEIDELGLKDEFAANLRPASFKRAFLERVKFCRNNDFPYLYEDHTFIKELERPEAFAEYTAHKPMNMIKTAQEVGPIEEKNHSINEDVANKMDAEDQQVYNQIIKNLNYFLLQNPTNEYLPIVVNNITKKVVDAILRKEYRFLPLSDVISGVMFDGMDVTPEMESVKDLVLCAFPEERSMNEGRGLA